MGSDLEKSLVTDIYMAYRYTGTQWQYEELTMVRLISPRHSFFYGYVCSVCVCVSVCECVCVSVYVCVCVCVYVRQYKMKVKQWGWHKLL